MVNLRIDQPDNLEVYAGEAKTIKQGESVRIGGTPTAQFGYGNYRYFWTPSASLDHPTDANPLATPDVSTEYTVNVYDGEDCSQSNQVWVYVNSSGTDLKEPTAGINLFPNPFTDNLILEYQGFSGDATFRIFDTVGHELICKVVTLSPGGIDKIEVAGLAPGSYIALIVARGVFCHKLLNKL